MIILAAGVLLFALLHGVAAVPRYKSYVKSLMGERWYGPVFGLASLFAIAVIVLGWRNSSFVAVYEPALWGWYVNYVLTFIGFLCLGIFLFRGSYRQRLRFPMGIATVLLGGRASFRQWRPGKPYPFWRLVIGERGAYGGGRGQWHSPHTRG